MYGFLASVVVTSHVVVVGAAPIKPHWMSDYGEALRVARSSERPLVVLIENPGDPDESLDKQALMKEADSIRLLSKFELCRVDVTTKVGKEVAKAFGATEFPYTAVTDAKVRKLVYKGAEKRRPRQWIAMLAARHGPSRTTRSRPVFDVRSYSSRQNCFS